MPVQARTDAGHDDREQVVAQGVAVHVHLAHARAPRRVRGLQLGHAHVLALPTGHSISSLLHFVLHYQHSLGPCNGTLLQVSGAGSAPSLTGPAWPGAWRGQGPWTG